MANQLHGVTGLRYGNPRLADINARVPYLPGIYAQKRADDYNQEMMGLDKDRLALQGQSQNQNYGLSLRRLEEQQRQADINKALAEAGLAQSMEQFAMSQEMANRGLEEQARQFGVSQDQRARELEEQQRQYQSNLGLRREAMDDQRNQAKKANMIALGGLGANVAMNWGDIKKTGKDLKNWIIGDGGESNVVGGAKEILTGAPAPVQTFDKTIDMVETIPTETQNITIDMPTPVSNITIDKPVSFWDSATKLDTWKAPATDWGNWGKGIGGGLVGKGLGNTIGEALDIGGEKERSIVGGALGGAAASWLTGGDIYDNIFSGILGGITGLF